MPEACDIRTVSLEQAPHILVVDDEPELLTMVSHGLTQLDFRVSMAASAEEAYLLLERNSFDVVISDVMMPGEDGIAFLGRVHQRLPDVPVIIMTGHAQLQMAVNAIKNGAFDFIHKPFDFNYLRKVVEKAVNYAELLRIEKNYLSELERTVAQRTDELKVAVAQLEVTRMALLKAANDKCEFMATVTHEMRTPMNGVIGGLDLLADAGLSGAQREYLLLARQAADNMMELVERMLSFGDVAGRAGGVCLEAIDLPVAIEAVTMDHRARFAQKGLTFDVQMAPGVPRHIRCDGEQFTRLLDILLCNAFKFTEKGGARLDMALERMEDNMAVIRVTVSDSGSGIPADMLERIFEPFTQVDGSTTRRYRGAGLGLSIARQIAQVLNGQLSVESWPGVGSCFNLIMQVDVD
ncbi:MAG: response regulator [Geobacteraceae bacterium]|nr:response regulator [Geobacteraceae bacterium]